MLTLHAFDKWSCQQLIRCPNVLPSPQGLSIEDPAEKVMLFIHNRLQLINSHLRLQYLMIGFGNYFAAHFKGARLLNIP